MTNEIIYPMTLDYVPEWDAWEIVRELASNALDADPGFTMGLNDDGALVIKSKGSQLAIRHLLFGVSQKDSPDAVGQFGEGLKLALLVLTRMGLTAHIYSGGQHLWNEPAEMQGEKVFKIVWKDNVQDNGQTVIGIPGWTDDTFEARFVRPGDPRIIHTDPFGRSILEEAPPNIYVKGLWVQRGGSYGSSYTFGYNLTDVHMNRDRGVVDSWDANKEIGKIWASVTDEELLERFWQAVKDEAGEKDCQVHGLQIKNKPGMKKAFQAVYGADAVVKTDSAMAREAEYRGATVLSRAVVGGGTLANLAEELVGTDAEHVAQMEGDSRVYMPDKKLGDRQRKYIGMLRRLARRIGIDGQIRGYVLPPEVKGESAKDGVRISVGALDDAQKAIEVWLHEQAHQEFGTPDATAQHATAIAKVAARVIASYATR
jgi:hypothetical protein